MLVKMFVGFYFRFDWGFGFSCYVFLVAWEENFIVLFINKFLMYWVFNFWLIVDFFSNVFNVFNIWFLGGVYSMVLNVGLNVVV